MFQVMGVLKQGGDLTITTLKQLPSPPLVDFPHPGLAGALAGLAAVGGGAAGGSAGDGDGGSIFQFGDLMKELELATSDVPEIQPALKEHGLLTMEDIIEFLTEECGGVTADGLKQMGIRAFGTRKRVLQALLKTQQAPAEADDQEAKKEAEVPTPGNLGIVVEFTDTEGDKIEFRSEYDSATHSQSVSEYVNGKLELGNVDDLEIDQDEGSLKDVEGIIGLLPEQAPDIISRLRILFAATGRQSVLRYSRGGAMVHVQCVDDGGAVLESVAFTVS
jgi:hypothetical protein